MAYHNESYTISRIQIEPTENGGFAVECYKKPKEQKVSKGTNAPVPTMSYMEPTKFAFTSKGELDDFLDDVLGDEALEKASMSNYSRMRAKARKARAASI